MLCAYITTVCVPVYIREISGESKYHVIIIINILSTSAFSQYVNRIFLKRKCGNTNTPHASLTGTFVKYILKRGCHEKKNFAIFVLHPALWRTDGLQSGADTHSSSCQEQTLSISKYQLK